MCKNSTRDLQEVRNKYQRSSRSPHAVRICRSARLERWSSTIAWQSSRISSSIATRSTLWRCPYGSGRQSQSQQSQSTLPDSITPSGRCSFPAGPTVSLLRPDTSTKVSCVLFDVNALFASHIGGRSVTKIWMF